MQMVENMTTYVIIIFLSLFFLSMNIDAKCYQDSDCPKDMCSFLFKPKCIFTRYFPIYLGGICGCDRKTCP
ncbi:putative Late nodulin [Medicago truncatula]|nr:putative Late nodulin [Medicago truncatula]